MKKLLYFLAGMVVALPIYAFAQSQVANVYTDVDLLTGEEWYVEGIRNATLGGWMKGNDDGSFGPGGTVNRAQMAQILSNYDQYMMENTWDTIGDLMLIACEERPNDYYKSASVDYVNAVDKLCTQSE